MRAAAPLAAVPLDGSEAGSRHVALPRIAVLGAGHVGPVIARVVVAAGYHVTIAASGEPERIALVAGVLAPGAEPRWAPDAVDEADVVVLAIPVHKFAAFDSASVAGKIVIDTMNYWPPVDGVQEMFEDRRYGSSEIVQHRLDRSTVVKSLSHIGYHELDDERRPVGSPQRHALGVAGDDPGAVDVVAASASPGPNSHRPKETRRDHSTFRSGRRSRRQTWAVHTCPRPRHLRRCQPRR